MTAEQGIDIVRRAISSIDVSSLHPLFGYTTCVSVRIDERMSITGGIYSEVQNYINLFLPLRYSSSSEQQLYAIYAR